MISVLACWTAGLLDWTKWNHNDIDIERPDWLTGPGQVSRAYNISASAGSQHFKLKTFRPASRRTRPDHGWDSSLYLWNYLPYRDVINRNQMTLGWTQEYIGHCNPEHLQYEIARHNTIYRRQYFYGNLSQEKWANLKVLILLGFLWNRLFRRFESELKETFMFFQSKVDWL